MGLSARVEARASSDEHKLRLLGYKQELKRRLSFFHNFAVCLSYLSPMTGLTGTYVTLFSYGGPVTVVWTWVIVCSLNLLVGLALAEICSAYPTSGGVYYWAYKLGGRRTNRIAAWVAGWFNLLGQVACTAGVAYTTAILVADFVLLATGTAQGGGYVSSQKILLAIYGGVLVFIGLINTFFVRFLGAVGNISVWWHVFAGSFFVIMLPCVATTHQSAKWVFTEFIPDPSTGVHNSGFLFILGILGSQWAMVGYDTSAHIAEETKGADYSGPLSIIATIGASFLVGISFLLSVTFSIPDPNMLLDPSNATGGGNPVMEVAWQVFKTRYGSGTGGLILMGVPLICSLFCGNACVTANSRMLYAFSRDDAVPGSRWWKVVHPYFEAPVNAVWCCVVLCFLLFLPSLGNTVAFTAITSVGVVGLYISYAIPLGLRLFYMGDDFQKGPFHLGSFSTPIGIVAFVYLCFACVIFMLPYLYPVTAENLNYAPVTVGAVLVISITWWVLGANKWFTGPRRNTDSDEEEVEVVDEKVVAKAVDY